MSYLRSNVLINLSKEYDLNYKCLMTESSRKKFDKILSSESWADNKTRKDIIKKWLNSKDLEPPLELLWKLNEEEFLFVTTYFFINKNYESHLYENFELIYSETYDSETRQYAISIISNVLVTVINTYLIAEEELKNYFQNLVRNIIDQGVSLLEQNRLSGCFISDILNSVYIFDSCLLQFGICLLKQILSFSKSNFNVENVVSEHTNWTMKSADDASKMFIKEILGLIPTENAIDELKLAVDKSVINWKYFLICISTLLEKPEVGTMIKREVENWLNVAFERSDRWHLLVAFIVARHSCEEKAKNFNSYVSWFGLITYKNSTVFKLVFEFLTEIVPYERPLYLKIHVSKVPSAPPDCQETLEHYLNLAKIRLMELNESTEYLGIFKDLHESDKVGPPRDIIKAVNMFKENDIVPSAVLEAHVFRRPYYEKVFLKNLLSDDGKSNADCVRFIEKLNSIGKIPPLLYKKWKKL